MRKTLAISILAALGAATAGAFAADNISLQGSDTLKDLIIDELTTGGPYCALANPSGTNPAAAGNGLTYLGGGSGTAESAMSGGTPTQAVGPMSRNLRPAAGGVVCNNTQFDGAEGIVFALDGIAIVAASTSLATSVPHGSPDTDVAGNTCNGGAEDCDQTSDIASGLLHNNANIGVKKSITYSGGTFTPADWRDVLRIVYTGMPLGASIGTRDCNSDLRKAIIANWSNLFQNDCSSCVALRHALRRAGDSGTTDVFLGLLGLPTISFLSTVTPDVNLNNSPFCNVRRTADAWAAQPLPKPLQSPAPPANNVLRTRPYFEEFQDEDPVRVTCIGDGNLPGLPVGGQPANVATEQVCSAQGDLGVVLPIVVPATNPTTAPDPYATTPCAKNKFFFSKGALYNSFAAERCPNGDRPFGGNSCLYPATIANDGACMNGKNNLPAFKLFPAEATATDGRVYNLHVRKGVGAAAIYQTNNRPNLITATSGGDQQVPMIGGFYRIHSTRLGTGPAPSATAVVCQNDDATTQIGCLVQANPCSIGYAGRDAALATIAGVAGSTSRIKVNGLEPTDTCIQHLVSGGTPTTTYNLSRKLYFNSVIGFDKVGADAAGGTQQLELAKCMSTLAPATITGHGFVLIPGGGAAFCEDVNTSVCGSDINGCTDPARANPSPIPN